MVMLAQPCPSVALCQPGRQLSRGGGRPRPLIGRGRAARPLIGGWLRTAPGCQSQQPRLVGRVSQSVSGGRGCGSERQ